MRECVCVGAVGYGIKTYIHTCKHGYMHKQNGESISLPMRQISPKYGYEERIPIQAKQQ